MGNVQVESNGPRKYCYEFGGPLFQLRRSAI